jgi:hypothetical protein
LTDFKVKFGRHALAGTLILTFSLREKELFIKQWWHPVFRKSDGGLETAAPWSGLPLLLGEGWGEGDPIIATTAGKLMIG